MPIRGKYRHIAGKVVPFSVVMICAASAFVINAGATQGEPQVQEQTRRQLETFLSKPGFTGAGASKKVLANLSYSAIVSPFSYSFNSAGLITVSRDFQKVAVMDNSVKSSAYPYAVFVQNLNGSNRQEAMLDLDLVNPLDFSPNNTDLLLFGNKSVSGGVGAVSQLWRYRLTDGSLRRISPPNLFAYTGRYSPNGRKVAFVGAKFNRETSLDAANSESLPDISVFLAGADGSAPKRLRRGNSALCWSPSGKQLAFVSEGVGTAPQYQEIWSVEVATGKQHRILRVTGLSRVRSPDRGSSKLYAPYTFNKLVWLSENELLAEAAWGDRAFEKNGIVRLDTHGRITAKMQHCSVEPVSEKAFLCTAPGLAPDKKYYQFLIQITPRRK